MDSHSGQTPTNESLKTPHIGSLKQDCLSYLEVLSQAISVIAPSTVPAAILGLIFATAGNGTWLSFVLGMVGLVIVSLNINQFAKRSASPGSLYTYIVKGLGPIAGVLSGWGLLFGYMLTGMSTLCGFSIFGAMLLNQVGFHTSVIAWFALGTLGSCYIAYKDIQLSAKMMLSFEGASLIAVTVLGFIIWGHKGFAVDTVQLTLKGASPGGILTAIVLVVFGFSGFESSTSLGEEAKKPLTSIPRSVIQSVVFSGAIFTFMAYVVVLGFQDSSEDLGKTDAPLNFLATALGYGPLGVIINIGILLSFFSCTLACINSTARIVFSMARHGLFHDMLGHAHEKNETPHYAVFLSALLTFLIPAALYLSGISPFDGQGYFGTLCSFGFMLVYILISIAAPIYLKTIGQLRKMDLVYSVAGVGFMILPLIGTIGIPGSTLFPMPTYPNNILPWLFVVYMAIGLGFLLLQRFRYPAMIPTMKSNIRKVDVHFAEAESS